MHANVDFGSLAQKPVPQNARSVGSQVSPARSPPAHFHAPNDGSFRSTPYAVKFSLG